MPPPILTAREAVVELTTNPGKYTTYQSLLDLAARLPVDPVRTLPPGNPPPLTLTYSGGSGVKDLSMTPIAEGIGGASNGAVRTIGQSPLAEFLQHKVFSDAGERATRILNPSLAGEALTTATQNNFLFEATKGPWAEGSARFMQAAPGDVMSLTPLAGYDRTFAQIEIKEFLANPNSNNFNGIPKPVLQTAYDLAVVRGGPQAGISAATDLAAVTSGVNTASQIRITLDTHPETGRPLIREIDTGKLFEGRGEFRGLSFSTEVAPIETVRLSDKLFEASAENRVAFDRGAAALTEATTALKIVNVSGKIATGLGSAMMVVSLADAASDAKAAVDGGDLNRGQQIMTDWTLRTEGALAAGGLSGALAAEVLSPLLAGGIPGGVLYVGGVIGSSVIGATLGDAAVSNFLQVMRPTTIVPGNVAERIRPIGTVVIDESLNAPPTPAQVAQNLQNNLSPNGKEPLGAYISDGPGKSHYWRVLENGGTERIAQENFGREGSRVTVTSFAKGEVVPSQERQTVASQSGIVSDVLLKPDSTGQMVLSKIQLGSVLDIPAPKPEFNPLASSGTADNSYTVKSGDSLWKIGKSIGLSDSETVQFIRDTEASARANGTSASVNDLKPGNTLAFPQWVKAKLDSQAALNAVNGADHQSDNYVAPKDVAEPDPVFKTFVDEINSFLQSPRLPAIAVLADAGTGVVSDAGGGSGSAGGSSNQPTTPVTGAQPATNTLAPDSTNNYTHFLNTTGAALSPAQQDALASQLQSLNLGGTDALSFITLPGGSTVIANMDGDIVGEVRIETSGFTRLTNIYGETVYAAPGGNTLSAEQYSANQQSQMNTGLGLAQSVIGLQNWDRMSDTQRLSSVVGMYNQMSTMSDLSQGLSGGAPTEMGLLGSGLGFLSALESGNPLGVLQSGLSLSAQAVSFQSSILNGQAIAAELSGNVSSATTLSLEASQSASLAGGLGAAASVVGLVMAIESGNAFSIASSAVSTVMAFQSMMGIASSFGPYGVAIAVCLSILGSLFGGGEPYRPPIPDTPMSEGEAHAQWDGAGNTIVTVDQDAAGGGATAAAWMNHLTGALQTRLGSYSDAEGNGYGVVANLLPSVGFQYDPDNQGGIGTAQLILRWVDDDGNPQHRNYDRNGNRADGSTIAGDFMTHAQGAIAPNWQVQTVLAHYQQGQGINLPTLKEGLPQALGNSLQQSLQAITLDLPTEGIEQRAEAERLAELDYQNALALQDKLIDIDGDGYLEQTQWLANNQAVLAIDANGNGQIDAGELLALNTAGLNSLDWLDANNDQKIDARDPAFAALRLWIDLNGDAKSRGETQTLTQAGITAIDFGSNPPQIIRADNSSTTLTVQTLTGDILGVNYQSITGGVLQQDEQRNADGTLAGPLQTLHAINTRLFDGQAAHINGGVAAPTTPGSTQTVDAGDSRLSSTSARTIANQSLQINAMLGVGDARLTNGAAGKTLTNPATSTATTIRSNGIAFIPLGTTSAAQEQRQATEAMIRSADSGLFGTAGGVLPLAAVGIGVAALQWPTVAAAQTGSQTNADAGSGSWIAGQARNDSSTSGNRVDSNPVFTSQTSAPVIPGSTRDPVGATNTTSSTQSTSNTLNTAVQSQFDPSNQALAQQTRAQAAPVFIAVQNVSNSSSVIPDSIRDPGVSSGLSSSVASSPATTFTTSTGTVLAYPRAQGETANGVEDTQLRFAQSLLLANDATDNVASNPNLPSLRITAVFSPTHGNVSLQTGADGFAEVVFNPEANFHGTASFSYTVTDQYGLSSVATTTLRIAAVNDAPVTRDETAAGDEDTTLRFTAASLLANDSDADSAVDGDVLRITRVGSAQHGQVFLAPDGTVSFVPDLNYNGPAQFSYWVGDREATQILRGEGYETQGTMRLTVLPVNDLPVVTGETIANDEDIVLTINPALLLANDTDVDSATNGQTLTISAVGNAQHGSIALLADGTLQFTPERDYFGAAGFSYTVSDGAGGLVTGQVVVNLAPINDAPLLVGETIAFDEDTIQTISQASLLANDSDVDNPHSDLRIVAVGNATHGTIGLNPDGSIRFAPDADYFGLAGFTYTVSDGVGGFSVGTATLDIAPVNDAPRLVGESLTLDEDNQAHFSIASLLANDTDVDNAHGDLAITAVTIDPLSAANGGVSINNGHIVFAPTLNFNGQASFSYTVSDGVGGVSQASVNLTFNPINDAPVANSELVFGKRDVSYTFTQAALLANDTDVESPGNLRVGSISNVLNGAATLNSDGSVRFVPTEGYAGRGSFDYVVVDPDGGSSTATAQIDFSRINTSPITTDDSFTGYEDIALSITAAQLLVNDRDDDNALSDLRIVAVNGATNGAVSLQADGSVRFVGTANYYGAASFNYQVSDGDGGLTWATSQLTLQSVNDAPVIEAIWYGQPVYGYKSETTYSYDENGVGTITGYPIIAVTDEAEARLLNSTNDLAGSTNQFYLNGQLKPWFIDYDTVQLRQPGGMVAYDPDGDSSQITFSLAQSPQHGYAWINQYIPTALNNIAYMDVSVMPYYMVQSAGGWEYASHIFDPFTGYDPFTVAVTDGGGASIAVPIHTQHFGTSPELDGGSPGGGGGKKPVTLDLDGNGLHYIGLDDSQAYFDVNSDGWREHLAWVSAGDALLVLDKGVDRAIDRFDEISFTSYLPGARTDLEGLVAFDSNGDGVLSRLDARWREFAVWQDADGNGASTPQEVITLDDIGIVQIDLTSDQQLRMVDGVTEFGQTRFTWADGRTGAVGDVAFPIGDKAIAAVQTTPAPLSPEHTALLMVQMINTFTAAQDNQALATVPMSDAPDPQHLLLATQTQWEQAGQTGQLQAA